MQDNIDIEFSFEKIDATKITEFEKNKSIPPFVKKYFEIIKKGFRNHEKQPELLVIVEILIDFSWEMLNTNIWVFVDDIWRLVYGYSILYKTVILSRDATYSKDDLIRLCDMGLLMSGPLLQNEFLKLITIFNQPELNNLSDEPSK
jgi:hypothetical protein